MQHTKHRMVDITQLVNSRDKSSRLGRKYVVNRNQKVRWPGASEVKEWSCINDDLKGILEGLKGTAESTLNCMGEVIYNYYMEKPSRDDRLK